MFISVFSYTSVSDAKILSNSINTRFPYDEITEQSHEKYWKIEGMIVSKAEIKLFKSLSREELSMILKSVCDKWFTTGLCPITSIMASATVEGGCSFFDERVQMIVIDLDREKTELSWNEEEIIWYEEQERKKKKQPRKTRFLKLL